MPNSIDLTGKIALITGASKGIGAAIAKAYAKAGAHVILIARNQRKLEKIDDDIRKQGGTATLIPLDIMSFDNVDKLGPAIYEKFGKLDIFVANAAILGTLSPLSQISSREFQHVMDTNLTANFRLIKTLDPLLQKSEAGRAIFLTTGSDIVKGEAYWGGYAISKAALESMVRIYAAENNQSTLNINLADPVRVRTNMRASAKPGEDPLSLPHPDDIMSKFLELASSDCGLHGETINLQA